MDPRDEAVELLKLWDDGEAEIVRRLLDSYSIPCRVVSHISHSLWPLTVNGLGEIRILVAPDQLEDAREILAEHRRQGMEMVPGGKPSEPSGAADAPDANDEATPEQDGPDDPS